MTELLLDREAFKALFKEEDQIKEVAGEIFTEVVELLLDFGYDPIHLQEFIAVKSEELTLLQNSVKEGETLSIQETEEFRKNAIYLSE